MHILLFDIDGTLIDSGGAGRSAMETALAEHFGVTEILPGIPYAGRTDWAIACDLLEWHGHPPSAENRERLMAAYLANLQACLTGRKGFVLPGVLELLNKLAKHEHLVIGLLTGNVRDGAFQKLKHFALDHFFVCGGFADGLVERNDVARHAFRQVIEHLKSEVAPDQVWVLGDTPADIACARAIGARAIGVATGSHTVEELQAAGADVVLADLSDHNALLEAWGCGTFCTEPA